MLNVSVGSSGSIVNLGNPEERKLLHCTCQSAGYHRKALYLYIRRRQRCRGGREAVSIS